MANVGNQKFINHNKTCVKKILFFMNVLAGILIMKKMVVDFAENVDVSFTKERKMACANFGEILLFISIFSYIAHFPTYVMKFHLA